MMKAYKWTIRFSILTPALLLLCIIAIGGGHGSFTPAVVLFPWATFNTIWQDNLSIIPAFLGAFQFVVYGVLIDKVKQHQNVVTMVIVASHVLLTVLILTLRGPAWR